MNLIVETDIGRDPDDFFALCFLVSAGVDIRAITISPGDLDQVAIAKFFLQEVGLDIPVGVGDVNRQKSSATGIHLSLLEKYKFPKKCNHDGDGEEVIRETFNCYPDSELFCCGPLKSVGKYLLSHSLISELFIKRSTMQGGFIGYDVHGLEVPRLKKFEGLSVCSTFNLGGDKNGAFSYVSSNLIKERNWIGKNICHVIVYDKDVHDSVMSIKPKNRSGELLREGMSMYLKRHTEKKFHDPSAAVCMLYPEIATWVKAKPYYAKGKWGCYIDKSGDGDNVAINIDIEKLWKIISES